MTCARTKYHKIGMDSASIPKFVKFGLQNYTNFACLYNTLTITSFRPCLVHRPSA